MNAPVLSFEFFPPRTDVQQRRFWTTLGCLQTLNPAYVSMTWGALGTTSQASMDVLEALVTDAKVPITSHLTCVGQTADSIRETIAQLESIGIRRFLALRGDAQKEQMQPGGLEHACELVSILAEDASRDISVAAYPEKHPESANTATDIHYLKEKLDAGASKAITQFFFEADTFLRFRDQALKAGVSKPLVPGILPIHDIAKVQQFSSQCGATVPPKLIERFEKATDSRAKHDLAVKHSAELCRTLQREDVNEFHVYTLNQSPLSYRLARVLAGREQKVEVAA